MVLKDFVPALSMLAPAFVHPADKIHVMYSPEEFYSTLIDQIDKAEKRIVIATLYIGVGEPLTDGFVEALRRKKDSVDMCILVDGERSWSDGSLCTLEGILGGKRIHGFGGSRRAWLGRVGEVVNGLQHMKFCVFDDNVVVSGANLGERYFVDRQDRYVMVENFPELANFFTQLVYAIRGDESVDVFLARHVRCIDINKEEGNVSSLDVGNEFLISSHDNIDHSKAAFIFPTMQLPVYGINQDYVFTQSLLNLVFSYKKTLCVHLSTGYFNMGETFGSLVEKKDKLKIYTSLGSGNLFRGTMGMSSFIPLMYMEKVYCSGLGSSVEFFDRSDWTFHCKGIFGEAKDGSVFMTQIGSSNYGTWIKL